MYVDLEGIKKVGIIDDYEDGRDTLAFMVEDANLEPVMQNESVNNLENYLTSLKDHFDAVVTDHHLRKVNSYFPIDGAELASHCYQRKIPSLLVTRYEKPEILEIRRFRQHLPVVLMPDEYNVDTLVKGLEKCIKEFKGVITADRKAWRTLIRVDDIKDKNVYIFIPGWDSKQAVGLNMNNLPDGLRKALKRDMRLFAQVNLGSENANELFICNWEF